VHLYSLSLPKAIGPELETLLRHVGLIPAKTSEVWPAASFPVQWDGEGSATWLTTDKPMFGIRPDHELSELAVELDGTIADTRRNVAAGSQLYVTIPPLRPGVHELIIRENPRVGVPAIHKLTVEAREPRSPDGSGPIRMWVQPFTTRLDELWNGTSSLCIAGPRQEVNLTIRLHARVGGELIREATFGAGVPLTAAGWLMLAQRHILDDDGWGSAYDQSRWCVIEADAGRYGRYRCEFERSIPPLRWRLSDLGGTYGLMLQDDTEAPLGPAVQWARWDRPDQFRDLSDDFTTATRPVAVEGGLFVASLRGLEPASMIVPRHQKRFRDPSELRCPISPESPDKSPRGVAERVRCTGAWARARLPGDPIARMWRGHVIRNLHGQMANAVSGTIWSRGEREFFHRPTLAVLDGLRRLLLSSYGGYESVARRLADQATAAQAWSVDERVQALGDLVGVASSTERTWTRIVERHASHSIHWAAEFYLRLATDASVDMWASGDLEDGLALAMACPLPFRVARVMALASLMAGGDGREELFPPLFEGWSWE